jgi:hypothetical protein
LCNAATAKMRWSQLQQVLANSCNGHRALR